MKFALVDGIKHEPQPKLRGVCSNCGAEMVSKCGRVKVWHWSHKSREHCDPWWENETEWHREWKNHFPVEWQEVSHTDPTTGEKHIADVKTPYGLTIEFQHSPIKAEERNSREEFYGDMIWIVDGNRNDLTKAYFDMGLSGPIQKDPLAYKIDWYGRSQFLNNWIENSAKVFFDFGEKLLWRFPFYDADKKTGMVGPVPKTVIIDDCLNGNPFRTAAIDEDSESTNLPAPLREIYRSDQKTD